jgi:hypothetical protein
VRSRARSAPGSPSPPRLPGSSSPLPLPAQVRRPKPLPAARAVELTDAELARALELTLAFEAHLKAADRLLFKIEHTPPELDGGEHHAAGASEREELDGDARAPLDAEVQ